MGYFRFDVEAMTGYKPGEQPPPGTPIIKLNTNENPYPPSPQAIAALRNYDPERLRRHPDPFAREFCQAVSDALDVPKDWIIVGNGSDELLNLLVRACADRNRAIAYPTPTYVLYRTVAAMQPCPTIEIAYPDHLTLPIDELTAANAAVTFLATPNSPTGHQISLDDLRKIVGEVTGVVAIDEAYVDFGEGSALPLLQEFNNIIILRTLSKGYSLAGLRLGFGIAHPDLLAGLFKVKDSYNIDGIATQVGAAAMRDQAYKNEWCDKVKESRQILSDKLAKLGFSVPKDPRGNFLLVTPPPGSLDASQLQTGLKQRNILVRYFAEPGLDQKLRITVGTDDQNQKLIDTLGDLLWAKGSAATSSL
ncbi:MAG: histidinol-phosphate transaminase [Cyanobacteria bacterium P01_C01_bin.89]